jgi:hypothetical protein
MTNAANATNAQATKRARSKKAQPVAEVQALTNDEAQAVEALAVEVVAEVAEVSAAEKAEAAQALLLAAIETRIKHAPNDNFAKNMRAELSQLSGRNALLAIEKCQALDVDFVTLSRCYAVTDKTAHDYIAIYAAQKIRKAIFALACGMTSVFDGYTQAILKNLIKLESLSNRGSQMSLSNKVVFSEDMQTQAVRSFKMCEPSTASTQASSTRQMLRFLNVCNVIKSRKDDSITLTDAAAAKKVQAMFTA